MKKQILSIFLTATMLLTLMPMAAFATGTTYAITNGTPEIAKETNNGYIAVDNETAADGDTVTVEVHPAEGYQLKSLTVTPTGFVDLGIKDAEDKPLYWKETNLGADNPQDPGDYYMWGATALMYSDVDCSKTDGAFTFVTGNPYGDDYKNIWDASLGFNWGNVPFADGVFKNADGERNVFTKYTTIDTYAKSGTPDNITTLQPEDDAATAENENWRMPTKDEFAALRNNCVLVWTSDYNSTGNAGYIVYKAKNDADKGKANINGTWKMWDADTSKYIDDTGSAPTGYSTSDIHIFLPAAGNGIGKDLKSLNTGGIYWSGTLSSENATAYALTAAKLGISLSAGQRQYGYSIRPVMSFSGITHENQTDYQFTMPGSAVTVTAEFEEIPVTIADILPEDFPANPENGWKDSAGSALYVSGNNLKFGGFTKNNALTSVVTKNNNKYIYSDQYCTITFFIENEEIVKVKLEDSGTYDGEYLPPSIAPTEGEGYSIDYINEKAIIEDGYEVSKTNNPFTVESLTDQKLDITPNTTYYIRKAEVSGAKAASNATAFKTPSRPIVSGVEAHQESVMKRDDAALYGIDETMEYSYSFNNGAYSSWLNGNGITIGFMFDIEPTPATRYDVKVRIKATETNFRGEETTYTFLPSEKKITVKIGTSTEQVSYDEKLVKPVDPTKEGYTFGGWYLDEDCTTAWNFEMDTVFDQLDGYPDDIKLYPKWIENSLNPIATETANITGETEDISGVKIELYKGRNLVVSTMTDANGNYELGNILPGYYNLVITKSAFLSDDKITTTLINIEDSTVPEVEVSNKNVSSIFENWFAVEETRSNSDMIMVGGLDLIADSENPGTDENITIKLIIEPTMDFGTEEQEDIKKKAGSQKHFEFFNISLSRTIDYNMPEDIGDDINQLISIIIPFDFNNVDANSVVVIRNHKGEIVTLTNVSNDNGECIIVDEKAGTITVKAMKFSDYAIAYEEISKSPNTGVFGGTYLLLISLSAVGIFIAARKKQRN